jgi:REP element-mobilizing transposase RayT
MRKVQFVNGEYYHLFNRGVDKREVFLCQKDLDRFFQSMSEFNTLIPIGSIYAASFRKNNPLSPLRNLVSKTGKLVDFICYCLCPNHYHFILRQSANRGIEKFMHRLGLGYTNYFNKKYKRSGSLFQGTFKANHIDSDEYLLYASAYVNLNYKVHQLTSKFFISSWGNYIQLEGKEKFCDTDIILGQFVNVSEYKNFAENAVIIARERKELEKITKFDLET